MSEKKLKFVGKPIFVGYTEENILSKTSENDMDYRQLSLYYSQAGSIAPKKLVAKIQKCLSLLDCFKAKKTEIGYSFWEEFIKEKHIYTSPIHHITSFLISALGSELGNYANRFPLFFWRVAYETSGVRGSGNLFDFEECEENEARSIALASNATIDHPELGEISRPVLMSNTLCEVLALILVRVNQWKVSEVRKFLCKSGYTVAESRHISKEVSELYSLIETHIKRKFLDVKSTTSVPTLGKKVSYFLFWHKECQKRRFILNYSDNINNMQEEVKFVVSYLNKKYHTTNNLCEKCLFASSDIEPKKILNFENTSYCDKKLCRLKIELCYTIHSDFQINKHDVTGCSKCSEEDRFAQVIHSLLDQYGYFLFDLLLPYSAEKIAEYYIETGKLFVYDTIFQFLDTLTYFPEVNQNTILNQPSEYQTYLSTQKTRIEEKVKEGKQNLDNVGFLIGLYFWDKINIEKVNRSTFANEGKVENISKTETFAGTVIQSLIEGDKFSHFLLSQTKKKTGIIDHTDKYRKQYFDMLKLAEANRTSERLRRVEETKNDYLSALTHNYDIKRLTDMCHRQYLRISEILKDPSGRLLQVEEAMRRHSRKSRTT